MLKAQSFYKMAYFLTSIYLQENTDHLVHTFRIFKYFELKGFQYCFVAEGRLQRHYTETPS